MEDAGAGRCVCGCACACMCLSVFACVCVAGEIGSAGVRSSRDQVKVEKVEGV